MLKKAKIAFLLIMTLVFALQGVGMETASAAVDKDTWTADEVTYANLLKGLDEAAGTGLVAETYYQSSHSEANVIADKVIRKSDEPFLISGRANASMPYNMVVSVELPTYHLADEMTFALYTKDEDGYHYTGIYKTVEVEGKQEVDINFGRITDEDLRFHELYVFQIEGNNIIEEGEWNSDWMKPEYGPPASTGVDGVIYIGSMEYQKPDNGKPESECKIFQPLDGEFSTKDFEGTISKLQFGPNIRLYRKTDSGYDPLPASGTAEEAAMGPVDEIYIKDESWIDSWGDAGYLKFMYVTYNGSSYVLYGDHEITVTYEAANKAKNLLDDLANLSYNLANSALGLGGTSIQGPGGEPLETGGSTVTGTITDGRVVSLYTVPVENGIVQARKYLDEASQDPETGDNYQTGWTNDGLPIASNEYVVINVVVPPNTPYIDFTTQASNVSIYNGNGDTDLHGDWGNGSPVSFGRLIWNPVTLVGNEYVPYTGKVYVGGGGAGIYLAPNSVQMSNSNPQETSGTTANACTLISRYVKQGGQEIHQTSFDSAGTYVRMTNLRPVDVTGTKTWAGEPENYTGRPDSIEVILYASFWNGSKYEAPQPVKTITVKPDKDGNWSWEFDGLPRYGEIGYMPIMYTVKEKPISKYTPTYTENTNWMDPKYKGLNITNTYNETVAVVSGKKIWDDANDQDGKRPDKITVVLQGRYMTSDEGSEWSSWDNLSNYKDSGVFNDYKDTLTVTAADNWKWTFEPVHTAYGSDPTYYWQYRVIETKFNDETIIGAEEIVEGGDIKTEEGDTCYDVSYSNNGEDSSKVTDPYNITNTHMPEKITFSGKKEWLPADLSISNKTPVNVTLCIVNDDNSVTETNLTATANAENGWTWTFKNLDKYKDGKIIQYTVKEKHPPQGFWSEVKKDASGNITVYNIAKNIQLKGTKYWRDENNNDITNQLPDSIKNNGIYVEIIRKPDNMVVEKIWLGRGNWSWSVDVPGVDTNGQIAEYDIKEIIIPNYSSTSDMTSVQKNVNNYVEIQNWEVINQLQTIEMEVTKEWKDTDPSLRPSQIRFVLLRDNAEVYKNNTLVAIEYDVANPPSEPLKFTGLEQYKEDGTKYEYSVKEQYWKTDNWQRWDDVWPGYTSSAVTSNVDAEGNLICRVTNAIETVNISGKKTWQNYGPSHPTVVKLKVYYSAYGSQPTLYTTKEITGNDRAPSWDWTIADLPKYINGLPVTYTVEEEYVAGYQTTVSGDMSNGFEVTNTKVKTGNIQLYKHDANDVSIHLNGAEFALYYDQACQQEVPNTRQTTARVQVGKDIRDGWLIIKDLLPGTYYIREETPPTGYALPVPNDAIPVTVEADNNDNRVNGHLQPNDPSYRKVLNSKIVTTSASATATKAWVNTDGTTTAPNGATVVFTLYADGEATEYTVTLDGTAETTAPTTTGGYESEAWKATFVNLPKYQNGTTTEIVYTIAETTGYPGYTASTTDPVAAGSEIINTQVKTEVYATKAWLNTDGTTTAPTGASVVFTLYADGNATNYTVTLDGTAETTAPTTTGGYESEAWKATFVNLPKYQAGTTTEITYTIAETTGYPGYTASTTDPVAARGEITNTQVKTEVYATKAWVNTDGTTTAPTGASVVFTLYADGNATNYTVTLDGAKDTTVPTTTGGYESEAWKATFVNLPKYRAGTTTEIVYTIAETTGHPGYTASTTAPVAAGGEITNTQVEVKTTATIRAEKEVNKQDPAELDKYSFQLYKLVPDSNDPTKMVEVKVDDPVSNNGRSIIFRQQTYTEEGTYQYVIRELPGTADDMVYDTTAYNVTVAVAKDEAGQLQAEIEYDSWDNAPPVFQNWTTLEVEIPVAKRIVAPEGETVNEEFIFRMEPYASSPARAMPTDAITDSSGLHAIATVEGENTTNFTKVVFTAESIQSSTGQEFAWVVKEVKGDNEDEIEYDTTAYCYLITIGMNENNEPYLMDRELRDKDHKVIGTTKIEIQKGTSSEYGKFIAGTDEAGNKTYSNAIVFTNTMKTTSITVYKHWSDGNVQDISGALQLWKIVDGKETNVTEKNRNNLEYNATNKSYTWSNLRLKDNGQPITYVVKETAPTGYEVEYPKNEQGVDQGYAANDQTITNKLLTTSVTVTKEWADGEPEGEAADVSASLTLYKGNDEEVTKDASGADLRVSRNGNQYTWSNLPAEAEDGTAIVYYVKESKQSGYADAVYVDQNGTVKTQANDGDKIINAKAVSAEIKATKLLNGAVPGEGQFSFTLAGEKVDASPKRNNASGEVEFTVGPFDAEGSYQYTLAEEIPAGAVENKLNGMTYDGATYNVVVKVERDRATQKMVATVDYNQSTMPVFRNTYEAEGTEQKLNVSKQLLNWAHVPNGEEHTFEFTLVAAENCPAGYTIADGTEEIKFTKTSDGAETQTVTDAFKVQFTAANSYEFTVTESRKCCDAIVGDTGAYKVTVKVEDVAGKLTVTETKITKDSEEVQSMLFVNTYQVTSISGTKVWDDANNQDGVRPDSITINVMNGTTLVASQTLTAANVDASNANVWNWTFTDLPKYTVDTTGNATLIVYTVEEVTTDANDEKLPWVQYYTGKVEENATKTRFVITNTHAPGTVNITVTKVWEDNNATSRPAITLTLYKGENVVVTDAQGEKLAPTVNGNEYTWSGLPEKENGQTITYYVKETVPVGYEVEYPKNAQGEDQGYAENGQTITNKLVTTSISGTKVWDDTNNQDGVRPDSITIKLLAGGQATDKSVTLTATEENDVKTWPTEWKFENLPKYDVDGGEIVYTVAEEGVTGYTTTIDQASYTITNTHAATEIDIKVTKSWEDDSNKLGKRPTSLTINLLADGTVIETKELTAANADTSNANVWTWTFTNLPLNKVGGVGTPVVYTVEEVTKDGDNDLPWVKDYTIGAVTRDAANGFKFTNTCKYAADGVLHLEATKAMSSHSDVQTMKDDQFTFGIFKGEVQVSTGTNAENGTIVFDEISYDQSDIGATYLYTVKELPGIAEDETYNYFYDGTVYNLSVSVTDGGNGELIVTKTITKGTEAVDAIEFTNTIKNKVGHIGVMKVDKADDKKGLADAVFGVYTQVDADGKIVKTSWVGDIRTGETGAGSLQNLPIGTYYVQESMAPKGYQLDETVYTVVVKEGETAMVNGEKVFNAKLGRLMLRKADRLNPDKALPGAVYTLYSDEACLPETKVADITTGDDGIGYLDDVAPGTYWVKETKAPVGYEVDPLPYKVVIEENPDPEKPAFVQVTDFPLRGALVISKTVVGVEDTTETFLFDIELSIATADPIVGSYEATLNGVATEKVTFAATEKGAKATVSLKSGDTLAISGVREGVTYTVTEQSTGRYDVTVNNVKTNVATGTIKEAVATVAAFQNTLKQTGFTVEKVWQGAEGGEIELTLFANGVKVEPQPEYTKEGNKYSYADLTMVDEKGQEILYTVKETAMAGYATSYKNIAPYADKTDCAYNGGQIINQALTSFSVKKEWAGLAEGETTPAIQLTLYCNGTIVTKATPKPDAKGWYVYTDLPATVEGKAAVYTVKEEPLSGYTTTYINKGENAAVTDCAYNGSTIVNSKIPQTGDGTPLALWMTTMLLAALGLVGLKAYSRKREN